MFFSLRIWRDQRLTFKAWNKKDGGGEFDFDTRSAIKSRCNKPFLFFLDRIHLEGSNVVSVYKRDSSVGSQKWWSLCFSFTSRQDDMQQMRILNRFMSEHWFKMTSQEDLDLDPCFGPWAFGSWTFGSWASKERQPFEERLRQGRQGQPLHSWPDRQHRSAQNRAWKKRRKRWDLTRSKAKLWHMLLSNVGRHKVMVKVKGACMLLRGWVSSNGMGKVLPLINKGKMRSQFSQEQGQAGVHVPLHYRQGQGLGQV